MILRRGEVRKYLTPKWDLALRKSLWCVREMLRSPRRGAFENRRVDLGRKTKWWGTEKNSRGEHFAVWIRSKIITPRTRSYGLCTTTSLNPQVDFHLPVSSSRKPSGVDSLRIGICATRRGTVGTGTTRICCSFEDMSVLCVKWICVLRKY